MSSGLHGLRRKAVMTTGLSRLHGDARRAWTVQRQSFYESIESWHRIRGGTTSYRTRWHALQDAACSGGGALWALGKPVRESLRSDRGKGGKW